ncbi:MAG: hypothetical protein ACRDYV_13335 [Acidimicrobiia bacterium]
MTLLLLGVVLWVGPSMVLLFPLLFVGAGAVVVMIAEKDMRSRRSRSVRVLRTSHLSQKVRSAIKPERPIRTTDKATSLSARGPHRRTGPRRLPDDGKPSGPRRLPD